MALIYLDYTEIFMYIHIIKMKMLIINDPYLGNLRALR